MSTTFLAARDELFGMVKTVLDTAASGPIGYALDVRYIGLAQAAKPDMKKLWARVSHQVVTDGQAALADVNSQKLFEAHGLLYVQLFCPRNIGGMYDKTMQLALNLQTAFRAQSPSGEVWFRDQIVRPLTETDENYPIQFSSAFNYQTLQP
jgi:hypothetical protein